MDNQEMLNGVLETYQCILSCRKKMPGMKLEDAFNSAAVEDLEREYAWLQKQGEVRGKEIQKPEEFISI
jgi:hypothetical protein